MSGWNLAILVFTSFIWNHLESFYFWNWLLVGLVGLGIIDYGGVLELRGMPLYSVIINCFVNVFVRPKWRSKVKTPCILTCGTGSGNKYKTVYSPQWVFTF